MGLLVETASDDNKGINSINIQGTMKTAISRTGTILLFVLLMTESVCLGSDLVLNYDRAGQLSSIDYPGRNYIRYNYDLSGNMVELRRVAAIDWHEGDVIRDGVIDLRDVVAALQVLVGNPGGQTEPSADINGDTRIGTAEAIYLLNEVSE